MVEIAIWYATIGLVFGVVSMVSVIAWRAFDGELDAKDLGVAPIIGELLITALCLAVATVFWPFLIASLPVWLVGWSIGQILWSWSE